VLLTKKGLRSMFKVLKKESSFGWPEREKQISKFNNEKDKNCFITLQLLAMPVPSAAHQPVLDELHRLSSTPREPVSEPHHKSSDKE
jgi:hypothetical protein